MQKINHAENYDLIAEKWDDYMVESSYGISMVQRQLEYCSSGNEALDVSCGSGVE